MARPNLGRNLFGGRRDATRQQPYGLEPVLAGPTLLNGLLYALFVWLANAFIVLPLDRRGHRRQRVLERGRHALFRRSTHGVLRSVRAPLRALDGTLRH